MAQETQTGALYQPRGVGWGGRWEGGSKGSVYMYTYGWFMLRFDRKQQDYVKQLSFNFKKLKRKRKKKIETEHNVELSLMLQPNCFWMNWKVRWLAQANLRLITSNLDINAWTKALWEAVRTLNYRYRRDTKTPIELIFKIPSNKNKHYQYPKIHIRKK